MFAWFVLILLGAIWGASYMLIGTDEYEDPQCQTVAEKPGAYRVWHNKMKARAAINANLEIATGETRSNIMYAMIALRKAAALHAIRERGTK